MPRSLLKFYQKLRILKYKCLSDCQNVIGSPLIRQPVLLTGKGTIIFKGKVKLGYFPSPYFLSGYIHIEARHPDSVVEIEDGVLINNNSYLISDGPGIYIGRRTSLATHVEVIDSDFHGTDPGDHSAATAKKGKVVIGENVLINPNARIMRGVRIGDHSVIANSAVVAWSIPSRVVAFGNPARIITRFRAE